MIDYLLLFGAVLMLSVQHIFASLYPRLAKESNTYICTLLIGVTVLVFYACYGQFSFHYDRTTLLFGLLFGVAYCAGYIFEIKALAVGSVSITSLFLSYSLLIPTLFGIFYYHDQITFLFWIALALLALALFLINFEPTKQGQTKKKFNFTWLIFALLSFAGNGICTISQTMQQRQTGGLYRSEFMIFAMALVIVVNLVLTLVENKKKHNLKTSFKKGWWCAVILGLLNAGTNLFVMMMVSRGVLNISLIYSMISAGGLLLTFVLARIFFKEKLRPLQIVGFFIGIASVVLFNI